MHCVHRSLPRWQLMGIHGQSSARLFAARAATASETTEDLLSTFGVDVTSMAQQGQLDPVVGREQEIQRAIQILCRRTKCNPCFLGEAGVGKTAQNFPPFAALTHVWSAAHTGQPSTVGVAVGALVGDGVGQSRGALVADGVVAQVQDLEGRRERSAAARGERGPAERVR